MFSHPQPLYSSLSSTLLAHADLLPLRMSHIAQPESPSIPLPSTSSPIRVKQLFTRLRSSISCALNVVISAFVYDRSHPTVSSATVTANIYTQSPNASHIPVVAVPTQVYYYRGYFHNFSSTSLGYSLPPYPGTEGLPPRYGDIIDLEAGRVPIRESQRGKLVIFRHRGPEERQDFAGHRYPITATFLGGRSTVLPQAMNGNAWQLPETPKKLLLFTGCLVTFSGCIALAILIPKMHRTCNLCRLSPPVDR